MVFKAIKEDIDSGQFHFDWLIAGVSFLFWMRLLMMLRLTLTFGPLLSITQAMMQNMMAFFGIYIIQLISFSCVGMLLFAQVPVYRNLFSTFMMLFETSFGAFDLTIYDDLSPRKKYLGIAFHSFCIIANLLVLLNLVIAIMADAYSYLSEKKLGVYFTGVIELISTYENDNQYGVLVCPQAPFNMVTLPFLPFFAFSKNSKLLTKLNSFLCRLVYLPLILLLAIVFAVCNLLLIPFAYCKTVAHKVVLSFRNRSVSAIKDFIFYLLAGVPLLLISQFTDCYWFLNHAYNWE